MLRFLSHKQDIYEGKDGGKKEHKSIMKGKVNLPTEIFSGLIACKIELINYIMVIC
jgi:hypothetical protein